MRQEAYLCVDLIKAYMHTSYPLYIHTYIHIYIHTYIHTYMNQVSKIFDAGSLSVYRPHTSIHAYTSVRAYIHAYIHTYTHTCIHESGVKDI